MGYVRDISARISKARKYVWDTISRARNFIYTSAFAIGSEKVNGLLKETSSVPTFNAFIERLGDDSISTRCSLWTLCTSLSSVSGRTCS
ncbi:hypothetical protein B0H14DRAFT_2790246, partial [Mycena olivaceomarginata]